MKIVTIGFGSAGLTAAGYARMYNRQAEIVAFEKREYAVYHPCSLPDMISGVLPGPEALVEEAPKLPRFKLYTSTVVREVDRSGKRVIAQDLKTGREIEVEYDKLVLATGSVPYVPRAIRVEEGEEVYTVKTVEDAVAIREAAKKYKSAIVVGGSFIGIEVAHALRKVGVDVTLIEYFPQVMPGKLDPEIARHVAKVLEEEGIKLVLGQGVKEVTGPAGNKRVVTGDGEYKAGFVVMATGVRPETTLARQMGLEIGERGGIKVDEYLKTSDPDVYAAGDNVEVRDLVTGKPTLSLLGSTAVRMGRVAGINAAGGSLQFKGVVNAWVVNLEKIQFGAVGLTLETAKKAGIDAVGVTIAAPSKPKAYPGAGDITIRIVAEKGTGRILGGQVLGESDVLCRLDVLTTAVARGMTVKDLAELEMAYTPSLCDVIDPLHVAADAAMRRVFRKL